MLVLDAGAFVAIERGDREVIALIKRERLVGRAPLTHGGVVGPFDIRAMWVGGHSWGAAYTARFGCKAELADKVKG